MNPVQSAIAPAAAEIPAVPTTTSRIQSVDAIRGAVMILMALDHVRDFVSSAAMQFLPTDLSRATAAIFFTRWVTHFCAPVFAFTAGMSAFLWARRRTKAQLSRFLLTRGLWLIVLEITILRFILFSQVSYHNSVIVLLVIWMLGLSMLVLAALVHLPARWLAVLSIATIAGHNLLDGIDAKQFGSAAWVWNMLHQLGGFSLGSNTIAIAYTLVPWFAVMALGYCFGPVLLWESERRRRFLIKLGLALSLLFVAIRAVNLYGDPVSWSHQKSALFTGLSFLNCTKYPPSLLFLLMTLGPAFIAMAGLERLRFSGNHPLIVFGRVPFFYYTLHLAVIHLLVIFMGAVRYGWQSFLLLPAPSMGGPAEKFPANYGYDLWVVYVVWGLVIAISYPMCRWFAQVKQRRHDWWLSYL